MHVFIYIVILPTASQEAVHTSLDIPKELSSDQTTVVSPQDIVQIPQAFSVRISQVSNNVAI